MLSLRARLLASYLLLLVVTLSAITLALVVLLSNQPEPPEQTFTRLSALLQGLNVRAEFATRDSQVPPRLRLGTLDEDSERLSEIASESEARLLMVRLGPAGGVVFYDSAGRYAQGDPLPIAVQDDYSNPGLTRFETSLDNVRQVHGAFRDADDSEWLFSGLTLTSNQERIGVLIMVAEPRPVRSLQATLAAFGTTLFVPVLQAALAGLLIAGVLATLISRTLARPLQALSHAVDAAERGDLTHRVPVTGPPEIRAVAEAFNRMSASVQATRQSQRDFMANVSHDLKTPLTSIQGYSQAVMDGMGDPQQAAAVIHDEAERLNRMVGELADLARLEAGQLSMEMTRIDMGQLVANVGQKLSVVAQKAGVSLNVTAPSLPPINGDGDRLVQVLNNLVGNAIKFTPAGGQVNLVARLREGAAPRGVEVIVQDTGQGIPVEDLSRIFERFYQVDKARGPKRGTGLGLAITQEIVLAHGGRIDVQSAVGRGTRFTVWLPAPDLTTVVRPRADLRPGR